MLSVYEWLGLSLGGFMLIIQIALAIVTGLFFLVTYLNVRETKRLATFAESSYLASIRPLLVTVQPSATIEGEHLVRHPKLGNRNEKVQMFHTASKLVDNEGVLMISVPFMNVGPGVAIITNASLSSTRTGKGFENQEYALLSVGVYPGEVSRVSFFVPIYEWSRLTTYTQAGQKIPQSSIGEAEIKLNYENSDLSEKYTTTIRISSIRNSLESISEKARVSIGEKKHIDLSSLKHQ